MNIVAGRVVQLLLSGRVRWPSRAANLSHCRPPCHHHCCLLSSQTSSLTYPRPLMTGFKITWYNFFCSIFGRTRKHDCPLLMTGNHHSHHDSVMITPSPHLVTAWWPVIMMTPSCLAHTTHECCDAASTLNSVLVCKKVTGVQTPHQNRMNDQSKWISWSLCVFRQIFTWQKAIHPLRMLVLTFVLVKEHFLQTHTVHFGWSNQSLSSPSHSVEMKISKPHLVLKSSQNRKSVVWFNLGCTLVLTTGWSVLSHWRPKTYNTHSTSVVKITQQ